MKALTCSLFVLATLPLFAEIRTFTDKEGRKLEAELVKVEDDHISVKRKDGMLFDIPFDKLSEADIEFSKTWTAEKQVRELPAKILAFCAENAGKQVGDGESRTLVEEALKSAGSKRPPNEPDAWGAIIKHESAPIFPGDVLVFKDATFSNGTETGPQHTAVVVKTGENKKLTVAEQNWVGNKTVREREIDLSEMTSGTLTVYRPK